MASIQDQEDQAVVDDTETNGETPKKRLATSISRKSVRRRSYFLLLLPVLVAGLVFRNIAVSGYVDVSDMYGFSAPNITTPSFVFDTDSPFRLVDSGLGEFWYGTTANVSSSASSFVSDLVNVVWDTESDDNDIDDDGDKFIHEPEASPTNRETIAVSYTHLTLPTKA